MTRLYVAQGACSFAAHVVVKELNLSVEVVRVPLRTPDSPIYKLSPFGKVPALITDNNTLIVENSAVLPYLADFDPQQRLIAPAGTEKRAQIQSWLGFLSAEVHAGSFRFVNRAAEISDDQTAQDQIRAYGREKLFTNLKLIEQNLQGREFLVGDQLSVADLYLGIFLGWYARLDPEFVELPNLKAAWERFKQLPSVQQAQAEEQPQQEASLA